MNISIFGLGYVGCVSAACFSEKGHKIIGVDINHKKVDLINSGKATIVENGLEEMILNARHNRLLNATTNIENAVLKSEIGIICVGTPNLGNGKLNMENVISVAKEIGLALKKKESFFTITIRSTVMPGTNSLITSIISSVSGRTPNEEFAVISNPEFLREGNAIEDFFNPPFTVIGGQSNKGIIAIRTLFSFLSAPVKLVDINIAELIKFLNNSYHALKVAFANEVGRICKGLNVDSHELMKLFIADTQLNISSKYFIPGNAYGGSCLPKDLEALNAIAHENYINVPILDAIKRSNSYHKDVLFEIIISYGYKKIGIHGLSFKNDTDDLRYSPSVELCEKLIGKGYNLSIYDANVNLSKIVGKNNELLKKALPHIDKSLSIDITEFLISCDVLVFFHESDELIKNIEHIRPDTIVIDLSRIIQLMELKYYIGICW
jgi:GDP-mannose 6-dehydrogenase